MRQSLKLCLVCAAGLVLGGGCTSGVPVGWYKGTFPTYFTGIALDGKSGEALKQFHVEAILYDSKVSASRTVETTGNEYSFCLDTATINGRTYLTGLDLQGAHIKNVLGPAKEYLTLNVTAPGHQAKHIRLQKDKIAIDQVNILDIVLQPAE